MRSSAKVRLRGLSLATRERVPVLRLSGLVKQFGDDIVVENLTLDVPQGAIAGLVGPRGAGKTTVAAMAAGLLPPDEGQVAVYGIDLWEQREQARPLVGALPDDLTATEHLAAPHALACVGMMRGLDRPTVSGRVEELLITCGLTGARGTALRECAPGIRMRARLAAAMLAGPRLLVLDDVFEDIDPASAGVIRAVLREFTVAGGAVLCTASTPTPLETLCDQIGDIAGGRLGAIRSVRRNRPVPHARGSRARSVAGAAKKAPRPRGCA